MHLVNLLIRGLGLYVEDGSRIRLAQPTYSPRGFRRRGAGCSSTPILQGGLVGLEKMTAKHAAPHDDEVGKQPCKWRADGTGAHAASHAASHDARLGDPVNPVGFSTE